MSTIIHLVMDGTETWNPPLALCSGKPYRRPELSPREVVHFCDLCASITRRFDPRTPTSGDTPTTETEQP